MAGRFRTKQPPAIVRGEALWQDLGYTSLRTFQRARAAGTVKVRLYPIPGQARGVYALREDVEKDKARRKALAALEDTDMR